MILEYGIHTSEIMLTQTSVDFLGMNPVFKNHKRDRIFGCIHPAHVFRRRHSAHGAAGRALNAGIMGTAEGTAARGALDGS